MCRGAVIPSFTRSPLSDTTVIVISSGVPGATTMDCSRRRLKTSMSTSLVSGCLGCQLIDVSHDLHPPHRDHQVVLVPERGVPCRTLGQYLDLLGRAGSCRGRSTRGALRKRSIADNASNMRSEER